MEQVLKRRYLKNMPVKINKSQLRQLISEAIQSREPGSPIWSPPREKRQLVRESAEAVTSQVGQALGDYFRSQFNAKDPVQSEYGQEAWNVQVDIAVDEVVSNLIEKIEEVESKLHNGEFAEHDF